MSDSRYELYPKGNRVLSPADLIAMPGKAGFYFLKSIRRIDPAKDRHGLLTYIQPWQGSVIYICDEIHCHAGEVESFRHLIPDGVEVGESEAIEDLTPYEFDTGEIA